MMSDTATSTTDDRIDARSLGALLVNSSMIALAAVRHGRIVFANPAFQSLFHVKRPLAGCVLADIVGDTGDDRLSEALVAAARGPVGYSGRGHRGEQPSFDLELHLEYAEPGGEPTVLAFASDVTEQSRSKERLSYLAFSDVLTGLPNRALLADRLHQTLVTARRYAMRFAVLVADLDGFKAVNDTYGHDAGDIVLQQVARRFEGCIRDSDTLARLGGDEFAVVLPQMDDAEAAALVALRMIRALDEPLDLDGHAVVVGTSIGIATFPEHARSIHGLLVAADTALYAAKRAGKNGFRWATARAGAEPLLAAPTTWSVAHSVGILEIDDQHVHLAGLIDGLSAALRDGAAAGVVTAALDELVDYAAFHFASEERLMAQFQVGNLAQHRDVHRRLLEDIQQLGVDKSPPSVSLVLRYLREWLIRHVDGLDRAAGLELIAKGCC
jgi:diguanylate cyclase (GGDEF)-like protein/hemerythrin-like metal-binding protein